MYFTLRLISPAQSTQDQQVWREEWNLSFEPGLSCSIVDGCALNRCCNVAPAFTKLRNMGFTNVKVLYLADNFGISWANQGYRVERGR
jgi:hypothetical protein